MHLGSGLDDVCNPSPDVQIRTSSAMAAYAPIARKVFGNIGVGRAVRLRLFHSLVLSRLLYNVQTWSVLTQAAYNRLNSVYMRGIRRIAACLKFNAESAHVAGSDSFVRSLLGVPSLQCILMQRRLLLLASVLCNGSSRLTLLLSVIATGRRSLPWVKLIRDDLKRLATYHGSKMKELGDPIQHGKEWALFIQNFPREWRELVKAVFYNTMDMDVAAKPKTAPGEWGSQPLAAYACSRCSCTFRTARALEAHAKAKHKTRAPAAPKIGLSTICPGCHVDFNTRSRLLAHASEKRNRGRRAYSCSMLFASDLIKPVHVDEFSTACEADKRSRTAGRKAGHTVPLSQALAKRPRVGVSVLEQQLERKRKSAEGAEVTVLPGNAVQLDLLRPLKRARAKTPQDQVVLQHLSQTVG